MPSELFASDARRTIDDGPPLDEGAMHLMPERVIDQLVHRPLDLVALEDEDDLTGREIDAVRCQADFGEIEGRAPAISRAARGPLPSFRRATIATRFIGSPLCASDRSCGSSVSGWLLAASSLLRVDVLECIAGIGIRAGSGELE